MNTILVIEDNASVRENLGTLLKLEGHKVVMAADGRSLPRLLRESRPDLVLCDVMLPGKDGFELLSEFAGTSEFSSVAWIFLSAKTERTTVRRGMELGADDFLTKPFSRRDVLEAVNIRLRKVERLRSIRSNEAPGNTRSDEQEGADQEAFLRTLESRIRTEEPCHVLLCSIDHLSNLEFTLEAGDYEELQQLVARRLSNLFGGLGKVYRSDSREFLLICDSEVSSRRMVDGSRSVVNALREPMSPGAHMIFPAISVGASSYPEHGTDARTVFGAAHLAHVHSTEERGCSVSFFDDALLEHARDSLALPELLRHAIERDELDIYLQPKIDLRENRVYGMEALLRWNPVGMGFISPARFIPIAEETGLIVQLGEWVLKHACAMTNKLERRDLILSVNLSTAQVADEESFANLQETLLSLDFPLSRLELEVTESLVTRPEHTERLNKLRAMGIRLSMDDFGTGYSSLSRLKELPLDVVKVDRAFVRNIDGNSTDKYIVATIIRLARAVSADIVVEGVETRQQLDSLVSIGCNFFQGFYFSRPLPVWEFEHYLERPPRAPAMMEAIG